MGFVKGILQFIFFALFIGAGLAAAAIISNNLPMSDAPGMGTRISTYLNTNVAETTKDSAFPELRMKRYQAPPSLLIDIARRAAEALHWELGEQDAENHTIKAVVTTKLIQFKDDVLIRADPVQPSGSALYIRSSSRVGKGDLGANTRHVMNLIEAVYQLAPASTRIRDTDEEWSVVEKGEQESVTDAATDTATPAATEEAAGDAPAAGDAAGAAQESEAGEASDAAGAGDA
jgi:uncharacterized protein (DUF1499 family)